jgi:hypothetical protein
MKRAEIDGIRWRTAKQLYAAYLEKCERQDGASAADVIVACIAQREREQRLIEVFGNSAGDHALYRDAVNAIDHQIENVRASVMKIMRDEAAMGKWLAIGRRRPDSPHELIPARHWPFLTIDIENNSAIGKDSGFRELHCATTANIAKDHPLLVSFRCTNQRLLPEKIKEISSNVRPEQPDLARNGAPGRPSYMHLVEDEFKRRRDAGLLEPSVTKEAAALAAWFRTAYPKVSPLKPKSISNRLWDLYRAAKPSPRTP